MIVTIIKCLLAPSYVEIGATDGRAPIKLFSTIDIEGSRLRRNKGEETADLFAFAVTSIANCPPPPISDDLIFIEG